MHLNLNSLNRMLGVVMGVVYKSSLQHCPLTRAKLCTNNTVRKTLALIHSYSHLSNKDRQTDELLLKKHYGSKALARVKIQLQAHLKFWISEIQH